MLEWIDRLAGWWIDWRMQRVANRHAATVETQMLHASIDQSGAYDITFHAPDLVFLADQAVVLLDAHHAENYVEFDMLPRIDHAQRPVRVTVAWANGLSPAQKADELQQRLDALEARGIDL